MKKILLTFIVIALMLVANVCSAMQVKMLDVGQGDAILIQTDNKNILVDTADSAERKKLVYELDKAGVTKIDALILTHAHADHIGNASYLIRNFGVATVYDNGYLSASKFSRNYLKAVADNNVDYRKIQRGDILTLDADVKFEVVYPSDELDGLSVNNQSVVGRLVYGNFRMLFTGDIESEGETEILYSNSNIAASVLKSAHHGSRTSSLYNFIEAVNADAVVISAGKGNKYGHPHADSVAAYLAAGVNANNILCTSFNGTITIDTDGKTYTIIPAVKNVWARDYISDVKVYVKKARRIG